MTPTVPRSKSTRTRGTVGVRSKTMCACGVTCCTAILPRTSMWTSSAARAVPTWTSGAVSPSTGSSDGDSGIAVVSTTSPLFGPKVGSPTSRISHDSGSQNAVSAS